MHTWTCTYCKTLNKSDGIVCNKCKLINHPNIGSAEDPEMVRLVDSKSREATKKKIPRIDVGIYNPIFGNNLGGMAVTSVNMIGGPPGVGKTRLFLLLCDMVLGQEPYLERDVLYIANEQSKEELEDYCDMLHIVHTERIIYYNAFGGMRRGIEEVLDEKKPCLTVLDSLSNLIGEEVRAGKEIVKAFKRSSVHLKSPCLIVNQVTKDGNHAGYNDVLHTGDSVLHLDLNEQTGQRELYSTKNRFGPAPKTVGLLMDDEGIFYADPDFDEEER